MVKYCVCSLEYIHPVSIIIFLYNAFNSDDADNIGGFQLC